VFVGIAGQDWGEMAKDRREPLDVFVGRTAELTQLADAVARAEAGQPWLVTIEGDPGVGKTSLARRCLAGFPGLKVLPARAAQAETDLEFGVVDQLLRAAGDASRPVFPADANSSFTAGAHLLEVVGELGATGPLAIVLDDLQWADHRSVAALTFMLRRLSVDPVVAVLIHRGESDQLDDAARRLLMSIENRVRIPLGGLRRDEVAALAAELGEPLADETVQRLHQGTGGHPLYLRTILSDGSFNAGAPERLVLPRSLAAAIGDQLRTLPPETRDILEVLSVLNVHLPLAQLGQAAQASSPSAAIEPAVAAGLVDWAPDEPSSPVGLRHLLIRDAVYAGISPTRRRILHTRAAALVSESAAWEHRVAALDQPDEQLAADLEHLAEEELARGRLTLAATHLQWAADISPDRASRERRLLTAALHLLWVEEARAMTLRPAVEAMAPSPRRDLVLGGIALFSGQFAEAERRLTGALAQAQADPGGRLLAAQIANFLSGAHLLMGDGEKGAAYARWALGTGCLTAPAVAWSRAEISVGVLATAGPAAALAELGHLEDDPARIGPLDAECLAFRGMFKMLAGRLNPAVTDMTSGLKQARRGAPFTLGLQPYVYLVLAQYLAGRWDDVLLTCEQAFSAASIRSRRYELPLLHLAATCVPAGRGAAAEAAEHARAAEEAAASVDAYPLRLYAALARALVCQAAGDYLGMAGALGPWQDDAALDGRSRGRAALWRPLLAEGLIGSGQTGPAAAVLEQLRDNTGQASFLEPALAWLQGWLAEQQGDTSQAAEIYQRGEQHADTQSPVYTARLLLAHGRLLRRTGQRRMAVERLHQANDLYLALRARPFLARTERELAACHLPGSRRPAGRVAEQTVLTLTSRETEVAHLVGRGLSNPEIAAELFISRKAVEYHLSNIYAKCSLQGRQQLRRFVEQWPQPAPTMSG
jgi:DNA-binding CsgD family transcriptional regulator/tetratricopeptide (TPR) repeat protein